MIARWQLVSAGVPGHAIDYRIRTGRLEILYRGVYRMGPVRGRHEREMAAVLACGSEAVLCHGSAAMIWNMAVSAGPVHVGVTRGHPCPGDGIRVHRLRSLESQDVTRRAGLRLTTPARTILDLAGYLSVAELERSVASARRQEIVNGHELVRLLARQPRRRGANRLRRILALDGGPAFTRSKAEARLLELVRRAGLPPPRVNVKVHGWEVDFLWPPSRLIVEVDGYGFHGSRGAFERDRERDAALFDAGYRLLRVTWRKLVREPDLVLVRLVRALQSD